MLKKTIRRLGALAMVLAMAVSVFAVNASAADTLKSDGKTFTGLFEKTVTIKDEKDKTDHVLAPNATFEYEVATGTTGNVTFNSADGTTSTQVYVKAGPVGQNTPTIGSTAFTPDMAAADNYKYTKTSDITFAKGLFTAPGIYEYEITEKDVTYDGIVKDIRTIYMYVYVVNKENDKNEVIGYTVNQVILATKGTDGKMSKVAGFNNLYNLDGTNGQFDLTKVVEGSFGNKAKDWEFTIAVTGPTGEKYRTNKNNIQLKAGEAARPIQLKHGEHFIVYGVTAGDSFTITETDANKDEYTTTYQVGTDEVKSYNNGITATGAKLVTVYNKAQDTPSTGVIMSIAPYALMVVLAGAFAVVFLTRRNRAE